MKGIYNLVFVVTVISTFLALAHLVHASTEETHHAVPTVDKQLRSNEGVAAKTDDEVIQREEEQMNHEGFSVAEKRMIRETAEKFVFQAEVNKLMNIIINSLYSNKEVFLRELISNASDALDKIRFLSLTDPSTLNSGTALEIRIKPDRKTRTLTISDTGIGMTKKQLVENLGTIAKSGTSEFLEKIKNSTSSDNSLIGQFGVGFYSAFLVADDVTVVSKHNDDKQHIWESNAEGAFTVSEDPRGNTLNRGTSIILNLMEDAEEYCDENVLKQLVKKYSMFINFPIYMWVGTESEKEVPLTEEEIQAEREKRKKQKDEEESEEIKLEDESPEADDDFPKTKTVKETTYTWELMNETKPIWTRNPKDISDADYNEFYKVISKDSRDPMMKIHFLGEGEVEFKSLLYIPEKPLSNLYDGQDQKPIKLYVKRVFITDDFKDIIPRYLNFIRGIVDSDDLPLNVSREMLQESKIIDTIRRKIVRKAIAMFQTLAEDEDKTKYKQFWDKYAMNIKLGILEDAANKTRLSKLLMFYSSKTGELTFLQDYVDQMKEGQTQIYYLAGTSKDQVEKSPLLEQLISKGYEVLYLLDTVDEYAFQHLDKYDGKHKLTNVAREGLKFEGEKDEEKKEDISELTKWIKEQLGSKVEKVVASNRLAKSPSAVVSGAAGFTANMERIIKAQALHESHNNPYYNAPKKILEINPEHPLVKELASRIAADPEDATAKDIANLMFETALLSSGFSLDDTSSFSDRITAMLERSLNLHHEVPAGHKDEL